MSDMRKLLESMTKFAGEPEQKPGDQVRGTERAKKKKSGAHPFQGRLVGGGTESVIRELEKQLVEGELERRLREEFEQFNEFAPVGSGDGDDGFSDETLKRLAAEWWQGDEDPRIEQTLAAAGWEIGQDEGYDNGGVFVVMSGDEHGRSYLSWPAEELEGLSETRRGQVPMTLNPGETDNVEPDNLAGFRQLPAYKLGMAAQQKAGQQLIQQSPYTYQSDQDFAYRQGAFDAQQAAMNASFGKIKPLTTEQELDEKSVSQAQADLMAAVAHNPKFAKKVGIKQSVGREFHRADKKQNYKKLPKKISELGEPVPTATAGTVPTANMSAQNAKPAPIDPKDAAALKASLSKLKTSVPGLDITKATTTMAKADTGTQLNPADKNIASAFAPDLANLMKNPQMASQLKMMIDKADQQEKAAAAKPAGTV